MHGDDGGADVIAGLERVVKRLERGKDAAGGVLKKLAAGDAGLNGSAIGKLDGIAVGVAVVGDGLSDGIESERLRGDGGAGEKIGALVLGVAEADELLEQALDFTSDSLTIGRADGAVGAFGADGDGAGENLDDIAEGGIGNLKFGLQRVEVLQELIVLTGLIVVLHELRGSGRIVGELIDAAAAGKLLSGSVEVLLALQKSGEQIGNEIGVEADGHGGAPLLNDVDGGLQKRVDDGCDLGGGGVGVLEADEVGGLFVDVDAADTALQVLQLLENLAAGLLVGLGGLDIITDLKDQAGVGADGSETVDESLILESGDGADVGVVAGAAVPAGSDFAGVGDGDLEDGGGSDIAGRRRVEKICAASAVEVETELVLGVDGCGEIAGKGVERILQRGNFLIADLELSGKLAAGDGRSDVGALREDVLQAGGIGLRGEGETLSADDEGGTAGGGEGEAAVAGVDFGNVDKIRELSDELLALVDERAGILSGGLSGGDLGVHGGDLRGECVDLSDGLRDGKIGVALQGGEIGG